MKKNRKMEESEGKRVLKQGHSDKDYSHSSVYSVAVVQLNIFFELHHCF